MFCFLIPRRCRWVNIMLPFQGVAVSHWFSVISIISLYVSFFLSQGDAIGLMLCCPFRALLYLIGFRSYVLSAYMSRFSYWVNVMLPFQGVAVYNWLKTIYIISLWQRHRFIIIPHQFPLQS